MCKSYPLEIHINISTEEASVLDIYTYTDTHTNTDTHMYTDTHTDKPMYTDIHR